MVMKGNASTSPVVKELRLLCACKDVELDVVWRPRENEPQRIADLWPKMEDNSEWVLNYSHWSMHTCVLTKLKFECKGERKSVQPKTVAVTLQEAS